MIFINYQDDLRQYKVNEMKNTFLVARDQFMPEIY